MISVDFNRHMRYNLPDLKGGNYGYSVFTG